MKQSFLLSKYLKYLVWLAPVFITMGITIQLFSATWEPLSLSLILTGVLVLSLWLLSESNALPQFLGRRSTQAGTNVIISTVSMVVILGLINFLAVQSVQRVDLTENQLFTLAPQTKDVLASLNQPVNLIFFSTDTNRPFPVELELLNQYRRQSDRFTYQIVDPQAKPILAQEYGVQNRSGEIHLKWASKRQFLQPVNPSQVLTEQELTNGIVRILSDRQTTVYFLQGHGESSLDPGAEGLSNVVELLRDENYRVKPLNLAQSAQRLDPDQLIDPTLSLDQEAIVNNGLSSDSDLDSDNEPDVEDKPDANRLQIPRDADVIVIAGAERSLFEAEIDALQNYLKEKSGLLVLLNAQENPNLDPLFEEWGVEPLDYRILDYGSSDNKTPLIQNYGNHPITAAFGNNYSFYPDAQPINLDVNEFNDTDAQIESAPLLISSEHTQAFPISENGTPDINAENAIRGPLVLGIALNRPVKHTSVPIHSETEDQDQNQDTNEADEIPTREQKADLGESRLVVIGNSTFIHNSRVTQQLNSDVFLNTVGWLSQQTELITIRPKDVQNRRIVLDGPKLITIALTAIAILPLLGFGGAVTLWLQRR